MKLLLDNGAEVNAEGGIYGNALQAASYSGKETIVKLLLENGAEVNAEGGFCWNALQAGSYSGNEVIVKLLLENGAKVNAEGGRFENALQAASFSGDAAVVKVLLENGAEVNKWGGEYGNALQTALHKGYEAIVKLLLENGAEVKAKGGEYKKSKHSCKPYFINCRLLFSSQHLLGITTCWIAAEHALQHARNNISSVSKVFDKWRIQKSEYVVLAGFDESLIKSGVGYLEQIHIFVISEVDPSSPLLTELGRLFSPFSSTLFTESSSYRLPVFKDDGSEWEFDELVYLTASKFDDDASGYSTKTPLTIISLSQTPRLADGMTSFSQAEGSSGSGGGEKDEKLEKGKERDMGDKDEADKDNKNSDNPDNPPGDQDGIITGRDIIIDVNSEIYHIKLEDKQDTGPIQTLTMHSSLTIEVFLLLLLLCIA